MVWVPNTGKATGKAANTDVETVEPDAKRRLLTSCLLMQLCSKAVQSPALLIWNMTKLSEGTEVMVKGCHSANEIWGTFRNAY